MTKKEYEKIKEWDCKYEEDLICPYCGHKHSDSFEFYGEDETEMEMECHDCGKEFIYHTNIEYSLSSYKKDVKE